jgi:uncharacterized damage-inducible protein DinB
MSQDIQSGTAFPDGENGSISPASEEMLGRLDLVICRFERLIENRSRESLQQPGHDGRWGVAEVLCHLRDWEHVIHDRIWQIVEGERPEFEDPDVLMWSLENDYGAQDGHGVFRELAALRRSLIDGLRQTPEDAWERTCVLVDHGEMTLRDFLAHVVAHDERYVGEAREAIA